MSSNRFKVLIVEDDPGIVKFLKASLKSEDYDVIEADTGDAALQLISSHCPDLILLDLGLPDMDGNSIIGSVRSWTRMPIIVISARTNEEDKAKALDLGADDYLAKPFGTIELMARIRTALRHAGRREEEGSYRVGTLFVDPGRHIVRDGEREVTLTLKEFQLLCLMLRRQGTVFTRDELLNTIWGYDFDGASRTVDVHIRTLRQKLGESGEYIETVRGMGYKIAER